MINAVSVAVSISLAGSVISNVVELIRLVVRFDPLYRAIDCALNPVPVMVMVVVASPMNVLVGEIDTVVGDGFNTVKVNVLEVPPPGVGLVAVMEALVAVEKSDVVKNTSTCVELA